MTQPERSDSEDSEVERARRNSGEFGMRYFDAIDPAYIDITNRAQLVLEEWARALAERGFETSAAAAAICGGAAAVVIETLR